MKKEVLELIKYRLDEAEDSIKEAEVLLSEARQSRCFFSGMHPWINNSIFTL